jgi:hypothetical protein
VQFQNGVGACSARQCNAQVASLDSDADWCHAHAVQDSGDVFFAAKTASLWAASGSSDLCLQCGGHEKLQKYFGLREVIKQLQRLTSLQPELLN